MFLFVSYSHADATLADKLDTELKKRLPQPTDTAEIAVWRDRSAIGIRAGEEWRPAIDEQILDADIVLVLVTESSMESRYVDYEWAFALGARKTVVPLVVEREALPPRLECLQYFELGNEPHWEALAVELRRIIEARGLDRDLWLEKDPSEDPWR